MEQPLERIRVQHFELRRHLGALGALLEGGEGPREGRMREALRVLCELEHALPEHFATEEGAGYFPEVVTAAPRLAPRVEELRRQHVHFAQESRALVELARRALEEPDVWMRLEIRARELLQALAQHEAAESALVRQVFETLP